MNRALLMTIVFLVVCGLSSPAVEGKTPPKSICYELDGRGSGYYNEGVIVLNFKNGGMKTKSNDGTNKFYHITGAIGPFPTITYFPITGTAFWDIFGDEWDGHIMGGEAGAITHCSIFLYPDNYDLQLNCKRGSADTVSYDTTEIDCRTVTID